MQPLTENKIVLVTRRTRLDDLVARYNTVAQAQFYVEHLGADFGDYVAEHRQYEKAVGQTRSILGTLGRVQALDRSFLPNFVFGPQDTIVILGQDGLVANTLKYSSGQPIVGVNPDPKRWDGVLLPFQVGDLARIMPEVLAGRRERKQVTMAKAELNDGQVLYAVNDLFIGVKSHGSARYVIEDAPQHEQHSSSGIIVSTGLGSTGWFKSLMTGAIGIARQVTGQALDLPAATGFPWDSPFLYYTVREPFPSKTSSSALVFGKITADKPLTLVSLMAEAGVIFSDGIESDFLAFNSGSRATIGVAERQGQLVG
jgi:NAD kinase